MTDYNGWTNRETWLVSLHINNTEHTYRELMDMVKQAGNVGDLVEQIKERVGTTQTQCKARFPALASDMSGRDWRIVNWLEIAGNEWDDRDQD